MRVYPAVAGRAAVVFSYGVLLIDLTHTSHTAARTGIQRVARGLHAALAVRTAVCPVCLDPWLGDWRPLEGGELDRVRTGGNGAAREARWTTGQKLSGWGRRLLRRTPGLPPASGLIVPEIFSKAATTRLPALRQKIDGTAVALCFDLLPLSHPGFFPQPTVARFPSYVHELAGFDGVAAISRTTADQLAGYWNWLGIAQTPPVWILPIGIEPPPGGMPPPATNVPPRALCVGTIEGRKNHLALLEAAESLWAAGLSFELRLAGLARPETAAAVLRRMDELRARGRPLRHDGVLTEQELEADWADCSFSVYPSELEGYGLPVGESLARGRPCICAATGGPGELVAGGGCLGVEPADANALATAIRRLVEDDALRERLAQEARARRLPTWADAAGELLSWMDTLPRRS